jgi:hypothetical protein
MQCAHAQRLWIYAVSTSRLIDCIHFFDDFESLLDVARAAAAFAAPIADVCKVDADDVEFVLLFADVDVLVLAVFPLVACELADAESFCVVDDVWPGCDDRALAPAASRVASLPDEVSFALLPLPLPVPALVELLLLPPPVPLALELPVPVPLVVLLELPVVLALVSRSPSFELRPSLDSFVRFFFFLLLFFDAVAGVAGTGGGGVTAVASRCGIVGSCAL